MRRLALLSSLLLGTYAAASPPVQVELRSSWSAPSFLLQIVEAFHTEEPDSFFPFLHALTNPEWFHPDELAKDEDVYKFVVNTALAEGYLSDPGELASLDMSLGLHSSLPKLEAAYRYYADVHHSRVECDGGSWVDWYGQAVCDAATLARLAENELIDAEARRSPRLTGKVHLCTCLCGSICDNVSRPLPHPKLLPFDHILPEPEAVLERPARTAILYASLSSSNFRELHEYLYKASSDSHIEYVLRHMPPAGFPDIEAEDVYLSGYGVALDLKKMDYLALDDRRQGGDSADSESSDSTESVYDSDAVLALIHQYPENVIAGPSTPLAPEEILNVGLQAAQLLYDAGDEDALAVLKQLSQDFPKYTLDLARRVTVDEGLEGEVMTNQVKAQGGVSMVWLNGVVVPETDWNPFALLRLLRKERAVMRSI
ncbi:hypothetical protein NM688_g9120 [Phlebia brevispora]|uniref:Uncharacterized protein n=1 Tax=Phlebia brevispora TaxID=194682 RepID=A0ACC1RMS1_9APHY|nr:hypothetical protein NM688_g9120 [Phlebia brevispora]